MTDFSKAAVDTAIKERPVGAAPTIGLFSALAAAQAEMPAAVFNRTNPHFNSKYADLASLRAATLPSLTKHGLCIIQRTGFDAVNNFGLTTMLAHGPSNESVESFYPLPLATDKPQVMGSALTYARRYGWASIIGAASDDDDANMATKTISPSEEEELHALATECGVDLPAFCKWLGVEELQQIPRGKLNVVKTYMRAKKKGAKK